MPKRGESVSKSLPKLSQRIIDALVRAELREPDAWNRDSQRIARMTVASAARGDPNPWSRSFLAYFGKPHEKAFKIWSERSEQLEIELARCRAMVESEQAQPVQLAIDFEMLPPKKPPQSIRGEPTWKKREAAGARDKPLRASSGSS